MTNQTAQAGPAARLAAELDAVTDALHAAESRAVLERLLRRRAVLIGKLGPAAPAEARDSLQRALASGERLAARLRQDRTSHHEQLSRLYHAKVLLEALRMPAAPSRLDCQG
jgi:hypothetical protein